MKNTVDYSFLIVNHFSGVNHRPGEASKQRFYLYEELIFKTGISGRF